MEFNLVTNLNSCFQYIQENPPLLYYSHIPTAALALIIGFFVFWKDRSSLVNKILLFIGIGFALWSISDLVIWLTPDSGKIMIFWAWVNLFEMLVSVSTLYFAYVFLEKKDVSFKLKLFFILLLVAFVTFIPTKLNLTGFNYDNCESVQGPLINYYHVLEAFFSAWLLVYLVKKIWTARKGDERKQTIYLSLGVILFLLSFSGTNVYSSMTMQWEVLQYGLFGMVVFMGFLAYLIVKFKAFDIKLLGAQALIFAQFALIGAMFFFATSTTNIVLLAVTLVGTSIMGWYLIRSVKAEVQRKEELQMMSDKLAQANDQLRKLDNSKSEFISIASHQLRTPITAIKGFMSLLLEGSYGKINPKQEDALNKAYASNERLLNLVEDLLNVSRIESGRMEFKLAPTNIVDVCQEVVDTLSMKARDRKLYLDWQLPVKPVPELVIDGTKVREVISNMIDNALKYTEKGGVTVRVERGEFPISNFQFPNNDQNKNVQNSNDVREAVRVIVSDTGIGVPKEELPYLFSKFSRGKDVKRLNTGGTGLGLYVGKAMIEQNGGKIWAESDGEGLGSRFIIELPVVQSEELMKRWGNQS